MAHYRCIHYKGVVLISRCRAPRNDLGSCSVMIWTLFEQYDLQHMFSRKQSTIRVTRSHYTLLLLILQDWTPVTDSMRSDLHAENG